MNDAPPTIVWFRHDLRLADNPALVAGVARGPIVPVYVWSPADEGVWPPGAASRWWLHGSLASLDRDLRERGSALTIRRGKALAALLELAEDTGARAVVWSRRYEPAARACERAVETALRGRGLAVETVNASLLHEPWEVTTRAGRAFRAFTPFARACLERPPPPAPLPAPPALPTPHQRPRTLRLEELELEPAVDWAGGLRAGWRPGEGQAVAALERFARRGLSGYGERRDRPDLDATSRLSPHLHFGEIGPHQVWHALAGRPGADAYLRQLLWREFAYHLLHHFPQSANEPVQPAFGRFPWERDPDGLEAWRRGRTGYPLVDAAMRQLWLEGWMHNRVRMVAASFLVKDLLVAWQDGARWFWDTLVDADLANNTLGWQWTAGCGAHAAPFFRVFNPVTQGRRFDPGGVFVRRYVRELDTVPPEWIHRPWAAPEPVLSGSSGRSVEEKRAYPHPIVDHAEARRRALSAFAALRAS